MPKQVWQADDGTQFEHQKDCLLYERFLRHLSKRNIPEELQFLPNGETIQSIALNFYNLLNAVRTSLIFLESVELEAAPNERLLNEEKEKMRNEAEIAGRIDKGVAELKFEFAEDAEKEKKLTILEKIARCEIQGDTSSNYWKNIFELKEKTKDPNYALIAAFFEAFHKGKVPHRKMFDELINKINTDEIVSIFRDIEFNHKKFAWGYQ